MPMDYSKSNLKSANFYFEVLFMKDITFKILVAEDNQTMREVIRDVLHEAKYKVILADNGKAAKECLLLEDVDLILADIEMPFFSGLDLLEWVKSNKPTPMMLMTGFSRILETQKAAELGAIDFLAKPFSSSDLLGKLKLHLEPKPVAKPEDQDELDDLDNQFCKVAIEDFVSEKDSDYGVYIRISKSKYIKIAHQGGKLSPDRVEALKAKNVTHLYVKKEDFHKLVGFTLVLSKAISNSEILETEKRFRFLRYTGEVVLEQILAMGLNEQAVRDSKEFVTTSIDIVARDKDLGTTLQVLSEHTEYLYSHSLAVSLVSVMVAKELGFCTPPILFKLALGGLYHDVGKKEISKEILEKPRHNLTSEEIQILESHVRRGKELVETFKNIPSDVVQIIYEHHEDLLGQGYPRGLVGSRIHPLSQIVCVADVFCEYTMKERPDSQVLDPMAAIIRMQSFRGDSINRSALANLCKLVTKNK